MLDIDLIVVIDLFINIQKRPHLKIKIQCFLFCFFYFSIFGWTVHNGFPVFQNLFQCMADIEQIQGKGINIRKQSIFFTFPLPFQQIFISPFQCSHCLPAVRLQETLHIQKIFFIERCTVHFPPTLYQVMSFINKEEIIPLHPFREKTLQLCLRIKYIIIITDDGI